MLSALGVKVTLGDAMDNRHVMRTFFKKIPNNWPILANGSNKLWDIEDISTLIEIIWSN